MIRKMILSAGLGAAIIGLLAPSAQAVTEGPFSDTVSCDATITDTLKTFSQPTQGGLTFNKVSDEDGGFAEVVWALSSNGNSVGKKTVSPGNPVSWSGVLPSNYTFKIHPSTSHNCNSILPGDGNTTLTYKVSHT